jgi:hypothetical protein
MSENKKPLDLYKVESKCCGMDLFFDSFKEAYVEAKGVDKITRFREVIDGPDERDAEITRLREALKIAMDALGEVEDAVHLVWQRMFGR